MTADGTYTFDPGTDFDGLAAGETSTTSIRYQTSDGQGGTDTATVTVTVIGTNDAPVITEPTPDQGADDGETLSIPAGDAFGDTDASDQLTYSATGLPEGFSIDPDTGLITGTLGPDASRNGPFTIAVTAEDGNGGSTTDTFRLTAGNVAPVATSDAGTTPESEPLSGDVLANDRDGGDDDDAINVAQVGGVAANVGQATEGSNGGTFTIDSNGRYTFDPGADFSNLRDGETRDSSITYQVSDGQGGVATATLTVTVTGGNDAPVVTDPTPDLTVQDGSTVSIPAGDAFSDAEGDDLGYTAAGLPEGLAIDAETGLISGTLASDASVQGPYTISVTADDGNGGTVTHRFLLTPTNPAPQGAPDGASTGENASVTGNVLVNDADGGVDDDALSVSQVGGEAGRVGQPTAGSSGGTFTVNADGSYTFEPGADFDDLAAGETAITSISYQVSDGQGGTDTAIVTVTVTGTNDVPVAQPGTQTTNENTPVSARVPAASDIDGDIERYELVQGPGEGNGALTFNGDGSYIFEPGTDFDGLAPGESRAVTFTYAATDDQGQVSEPQQITLLVTGRNDAPVVDDGLEDQAPLAGSQITIPAGEAFRDIDGDSLTFTAAGLPEGLAIDPESGVISGTLAGDAAGNGPFAVTVTAMDGRGGRSVSSFLLVPVNPVAPPLPPDFTDLDVHVPDEPSEPTVTPAIPVTPGDFGASFTGFVPLAESAFSSSALGLEPPGELIRNPLDNTLPYGPEPAGAEPMILRYQGTQVDGSPLPGTITVNASTGELSGRLPPGMERARLTIIGIDEYGNTRTREVWVNAAGDIIDSGGGTADSTPERSTPYRRVEVSVDGRGDVSIQREQDGGNSMRVQGVRLDGRNVNIAVTDPNAADVAVYEASLGDGAPLPSGLSIDPQTGEIAGVLPQGMETLFVRITAVSSEGAARVLTVEVQLQETDSNLQSSGWQSLEAETRAALAELGVTQDSSQGARLVQSLHAG